LRFLKYYSYFKNLNLRFASRILKRVSIQIQNMLVI